MINDAMGASKDKRTCFTRRMLNISCLMNQNNIPLSLSHVNPSLAVVGLMLKHLLLPLDLLYR